MTASDWNAPRAWHSLAAPPWTESSPLDGVRATRRWSCAALATQLIVPTSTAASTRSASPTAGIAWSVDISSGGRRRSSRRTSTRRAGQPAGAAMSTAYVSGADGKLLRRVVDGQLDTSAPWPKAFHDPRNTNNAGTQP